MFVVGSFVVEYGGVEKVIFVGLFCSLLFVCLVVFGVVKLVGVLLEEETMVIAFALFFIVEGGGVYEIEGVNMFMKWFMILYV